MLNEQVQYVFIKSPIVNTPPGGYTDAQKNILMMMSGDEMSHNSALELNGMLNLFNRVDLLNIMRSHWISRFNAVKPAGSVHWWEQVVDAWMSAVYRDDVYRPASKLFSSVSREPHPWGGTSISKKTTAGDLIEFIIEYIYNESYWYKDYGITEDEANSPSFREVLKATIIPTLLEVWDVRRALTQKTLGIWNFPIFGLHDASGYPISKHGFKDPSEVIDLQKY